MSTTAKRVVAVTGNRVTTRVVVAKETHDALSPPPRTTTTTITTTITTTSTNGNNSMTTSCWNHIHPPSSLLSSSSYHLDVPNSNHHHHDRWRRHERSTCSTTCTSILELLLRPLQQLSMKWISLKLLLWRYIINNKGHLRWYRRRRQQQHRHNRSMIVAVVVVFSSRLQLLLLLQGLISFLIVQTGNAFIFPSTTHNVRVVSKLVPTIHVRTTALSSLSLSSLYESTQLLQYRQQPQQQQQPHDRWLTQSYSPARTATIPPTMMTTTKTTMIPSQMMLQTIRLPQNPIIRGFSSSSGYYSSSIQSMKQYQMSTLSTARTTTTSRNRGVLGFQIQNDDCSTTTTTTSLASTMHEEQRKETSAGHYRRSSRNEGPTSSTTPAAATATTSYQWTTSHKLDHPVSKATMAGMYDSNTRLQSSFISNVDSMAWNLPEPLIGTSTNVWNDAVSCGDSSEQSTTTTNEVVPWIPTEHDIDQLTVVQLKSELGLRAMKKVGNKYLLQCRFKEWIQTNNNNNSHPKKSSSSTTTTQRRRIGSSMSDGSITSSSTKVSSFLENEIPTWGIDSSTFLPDRETSSKRTMDQTDYHHHHHDTADEDAGIEEILLNVDSLQEWARTVDLEPLLHRREAIHREKLVGPPKDRSSSSSSSSSTSPVVVNQQLPSDLRGVIQKMFDQPSSVYSNWEVKQMYAASKHADQIGDRLLSKRILYELKIATPNDARVYRRLARMELEDNNDMLARSILHDGIQIHPQNAYLWHGLGQLEGSLGNVAAQRIHWEKAIEVDPYVPNSYHALGILDHTGGRVANAMKVLKKGIQYCPTNHRLHHALGDLYRDAKLLPLARLSYQKAIQHGPPVSHGFAYTALSYVAYEEGNIDQCRHYLRKAVHLNNGRHANGWVALAQMEESEGNIDAARTACMVGIGQYERGLIEQSRRTIKQQQSKMDTNRTNNDSTLSLSENPVSLRNKILQTIPTYRSGDRFFNVYRNWLRLEERYGTLESVEEVYERAIVAFPNEYKIMIDAAQYFVRLNMYSRARDAFTKACVRVNHPNVHAEPYRLFAEFEMQIGNYMEAQKILYTGATTLSKHSSSAMNASRRGLPQLFLTWAVCEWHLNNPSHAEKLFDYALRVTSSDTEETPKLRSVILYSMSRFEYDRRELRRAQHYVGLCLKENALPGGNGQVWDLWATIAYEMGNVKLAHQCQEQSSLARPNDGMNYEVHIDDTRKSLSDTLKSSHMNDRPDMYQLMRRDPWHAKIFTRINGKSSFINLSLLPRSDAQITVTH